MIPGIWIPSGANIKPILNRPTELNGVAWTWPAADGSDGDLFTTDGAGQITLATRHPETVYTSSTTTTDGIATTINITPALSDDTVYRATVKVLARCTTGGGTATTGDVWDAVLYATFRRSDTLTRVNWRTVYFAFDQALPANIEVVANDTTKLLQLEVQGFAGDTILWGVICELQEVST